MRYFVRYLVDRKILFRLDPAAGWSRFDSGAWSSVDVDDESFFADPFVEEIPARDLAAAQAIVS